MFSNQELSNISLEEDEDEIAGEKSCRLCRKVLPNEHFFNPKTGSLFAVCDICRKRKRDKYWSTT